MRVHYANESMGDVLKTLCGRSAALFGTRVAEDVTCQRCLKRLETMPIAPAELTESTPWVAPPETKSKPAMTWNANKQSELERIMRGPVDRPMFSGMAAALEVLVTAMVDGYSGGSVSGTYEQLGRMGTLIQTNGRGTSATIRQADMATQVDLAVRHAQRGWPRDAMLSAEEARAAWMLMEVGTGVIDRSGGGRRSWVPVTATVLSGVIGHMTAAHLGVMRRDMRKRVSVEMMARKLIPIPIRREDDSAERHIAWDRKMKAVDARRKELVMA